jgi:two-component system, sensor histidine kinase RegB
MNAASDVRAEPIDHRAEISLDWLVRLRWGAVAGQIATITAAQALFGPLRLGRLFLYVALYAATNVALAALRGRATSPRTLCGVVLTLDTFLLTGLLHAAGGAYNPFTVLYLVHITLAAVVLGPRWTWFLAALSVSCFALLFAVRGPVPGLGHGAELPPAHLRGMWVAFSVAAALTAYFVVKLSTAIERRDAAIAEMRASVARHERLASLTTLAAGAAHELGTPLATIAVASKELERSIRGLPGVHGERLLSDAALIRSEVDRCREILNRLSADAGQATGETPVELTASDLVEDVMGRLPERDRPRLRVASGGDGASARLPRLALVQLVLNLVRNALESGAATVELDLRIEAGLVRAMVRDRGAGMSREVLERVGEPFFSTKPPGAGLGLGVFIARTLSEQMGGRLALESEPGRGTTATVTIGLPAPVGEASGGD